ncbi:hypothetical protein SARC_05761 [Sphaeroforma arctica JP610]|uniref:Uncharacterized protein n=1 Tax=Sphaeroforma arctica JP610 TaxID=667725 RepID=A0A0L0G170_9EUKA|nr:hypothetical protein SARC_05761 [Sphaeroforma arctica JP610]KNC81948.1 hypothetical protein SARC_05761 [Sphaeroforma arctica JP610]|eukprot:XP_014155850.1 hypothetical protein SARC_05761 [Sphaeroforma arctica JP610]
MFALLLRKLIIIPACGHLPPRCAATIGSDALMPSSGASAMRLSGVELQEVLEFLSCDPTRGPEHPGLHHPRLQPWSAQQYILQTQTLCA